MALQRPDVDPVDGPPPAELVDGGHHGRRRRGGGPGNTVDVHYVGVAHSSGEEFDSSWKRGSPLRFPLGAGPRHRGVGPRASPG